MYLILIAVIIMLWLPQNVIHEGSHGLMAKCFGGKDIKLYPFPRWDGTSWFPKYFAYMTYRFESGSDISNRQRALISIAPLMTNTFLMLLFIIFLSASIPYQFVNITLVAAIMVQFIDGAVNLSSVFGKPKTVQDAWNFMNHASISLADMRIYSASWCLLFGTITLLQVLCLSQ